MSESSPTLMGILIALFVIWLIVRSVLINISMFFARRAVNRHPTEQNAYGVYKLLSKRLGVAINNHPKDWAKFRDMFYRINNSSEVPSELKEKIKARLMKKGLYINNVRINDNYKGEC